MTIPDYIVTRAADNHNTEQAHITEIKLSKRAKNGIFTIVNEKAFRKKTKGEFRRSKNIFKIGFILSHTESPSNKCPNKHNFFIKHPDFMGRINIKPENFFYLIDNCRIDKGVIQEKLIYTNRGFYPEDKVLEIKTTENNFAEATQKRELALKDRRVLKKNLVPGQVYATYVTNFTRMEIVIFYGHLKTSDPKVKLEVYQKCTEYTLSRGTFTPVNESPSLPKTIRYNLQGTRQSSKCSKKIGNSTDEYLNAGFGITYSRNLPKLWTLPEGHKYDFNIFDGISKEGMELCEFFLSHPYNKYQKMLDDVTGEPYMEGFKLKIDNMEKE